MYILRQNRWIAVLLGVILVCMSAIGLLLPEGKSQGLPSTRGFGMVPAAPQMKLPNAPKLALNIYRTGPSQEMWNKHAANFVIQHPMVRRLASTNESEALPGPSIHPQLHTPNQIFFSRTQQLAVSERSHATREYTLSAEELLLLQKIVMAEAEGEPYSGKIAVANVVLNRVRSAQFPDTIKKVIYQPYQFSPVDNGRFDRVKPSEDTVHAVNEALNGVKQVSDDTYYFLSLRLATDLTVHHTRTFTKRIGNHSFYK